MMYIIPTLFSSYKQEYTLAVNNCAQAIMQIGFVCGIHLDMHPAGRGVNVSAKRLSSAIDILDEVKGFRGEDPARRWRWDGISFGYFFLSSAVSSHISIYSLLRHGSLA